MEIICSECPATGTDYQLTGPLQIVFNEINLCSDDRATGITAETAEAYLGLKGCFHRTTRAVANVGPSYGRNHHTQIAEEPLIHVGKVAVWSTQGYGNYRRCATGPDKLLSPSSA